MFRAAMTLTAALLVASCADAGSTMDPSLTEDYCAVMTASQFKSAQASASSIFQGKIGGIPVKAYYKNDDDNLGMPKRGVLSVPKGTRVKIGEGDKAMFIRARKNTLVARGEGGPVCGPVS